MREITLEELLEAGCHFGHQVTRSNPKARDFIFEARDNIHIIDLAKTKEGLDEAASFIKSLAEKEGSSLIIVGTKRQARTIVAEAFEKAKEEDKIKGLFYVSNRWIGGLLTNLSEVAKNFKKLKNLEEKLKNKEEREKYTKKEIGLWDKEKSKLIGFYGGVTDMEKIPDALFIIDSHMEDLAVKEAKKMGVTTVAIVDTNADPALIDYPIPANDDAVGSLKLIIDHIVDSWIEGRKNVKVNEELGIKNQGEAEFKKEKVEDKKEKIKKVKKEKKIKKAAVKKKSKVSKVNPNS